ncbi:MAG: hypothetical protein A2X49_04530 [Lentisphaerae bacterium GWF2_52_8]|nr:MAG: hypothetical protein A2X49_04530 [Lentisphaerae bacterium GWF2_52_8]
MKWLKKIIGKDDKFFDLLEASAAEAKASVSIMSQIMDTLETEDHNRQLGELAISKRKDKRITQDITELLCKTFVTPLDREDIEALSHSLYRIPKTAAKISDRLMICPFAPQARPLIRRQIELLKNAVEVLQDIVGLLRKSPDLDKAKCYSDQLHQIEGEADKLMVELLKSLYAGEQDLRSAMAIKDISELLERAVDRCRDSGNIVFQIVLKHS